MEKLPSSHDAYFEARKAYRENSDVKVCKLKFVHEEMTRVMAKITKHAINSPVFRVLGVGSGGGEADLEILTTVATHLQSSQKGKPSIHTCIVEPSSSLLADFKTAVSPLPAQLANLADVSFKWREGTFDDYIKSSPETEYFNMVHFVFSLYYMDAEESLKSSYNRLADGGVIFCAVGTQESYFLKLSRRFPELKSESIQKFYTEVDLAAIAERNGWKYEQLSKDKYAVNISSCFDESSRTGRFLLDFLTHQIDFRATADEKLLRSVMDFYTEISTTDIKGNRVFYAEFTAVAIYK